MVRQKITPFLWFDHQAEEAANFYVSLFKNSKFTKVTRRPEGTPGEPGSVLTVEFQIEGIEFVALNGGPHFQFTEAISLSVDCATQAEVDELWEKLSAGGAKGRCGWLKDRYGLSWQIVPTVLSKMISDPDGAKSKRVVEAMLTMSKLDITILEQAYRGE